MFLLKKKTALRNNRQDGYWQICLTGTGERKNLFGGSIYRLSELPDEDLLEEDDALAGLVYQENRTGEKKHCCIITNFPEQEFTLKEGNKVSCKDGKNR